MNKTEKLLAARKKLKEFQLNKSNHDQVIASNPHDREHVVSSQDNNVTSNHCENNDNSNVDTTINEQLQILSDSAITNSTNNVENSIHVASFTHSYKQNSDIMKQRNGNNDDIGENFQSTSRANENKLSNDYTNIPTELLSNKTGIIETINAPIYCNTDDIKLLNMDTTKNGADFFDNANTVQNISHKMPTINDDLIQINENTADKIDVEANFNVEHDNNTLSSYVESDKNTIAQHETQVNELQSKIIKLESLLDEKIAESNSYVNQINGLTQQIQVYYQASQILVTEKTELTKSLSHYQTLAEDKSHEVNELHDKLKCANSRITDIERDLIAVKNNSQHDKMLYDKLINDYTKIEKQYIELKKVREEQLLESSELQQDLNIKRSELINLQQKLDENKNSLSLAELKIQQLTNVPQQHNDEIDNQHDIQASLNKQLLQLNENIKLITTEKDDMCKHYESYVKQLNINYETTMQELQQAQIKINEFNEREDSLIQRLSIVEQNYQREKQKVESLLPLQAHEENISRLTQSIDILVSERETLQKTLIEKEVEIKSMNDELQELRDLRDQSVESSKLVTALESEQVGASRAVSQNQQLKLQLNEMHDAFVMLSNSKLNLTEQLQDERSLGRKLNAEYSKIEAERDALKDELNRKSAIIDELEKDKLHYVQIADQMQHYQVQSSQAHTLQDELQNALHTIETLKNDNELLNKKINDTSDIGIDDNKINEQSIKCIEDVNSSRQILNEQGETCERVVDKLQNNSYDTLVESQKKLELRFKEAMERVADLTDEKQRLEHLVLQLQDETETIGEYVTLYQRQRSILQMKAQDKERSLNQLIEERNQQKAQLHQLKILVGQLLKFDENTSDTYTSYQHVLPDNHKQNQYLPGIPEHDETDNNIDKEQSKKLTIVNVRNETTSKILDLLTEIKDCKDMCTAEPNIHHCLWCSGKLITV